MRREKKSFPLVNNPISFLKSYILNHRTDKWLWRKFKRLVWLGEIFGNTQLK